MDEIEAMKAIAGSLEKLSGEERVRVLGWANSKYSFSPASASPTKPSTSPDVEPAASKPTTKPVSAPKAKGSKKAKSIISMDKSLNLSPGGKKSAATFAGEKAPQNVLQKAVVAAYYLRDVLEVEAVTAQGVFTFFKTLNWPVPSDMKNTLQQAGTKGWLDTKESEDIKITSMGENLVEHSLPPKPKS